MTKFMHTMIKFSEIRVQGTIRNSGLALHKQETQNLHETKLSIYDGSNIYLVPIEDILYFKADHVYVEVHTKHQGILVQRKALTEMLEDLPPTCSSQFCDQPESGHGLAAPVCVCPKHNYSH